MLFCLIVIRGFSWKETVPAIEPPHISIPTCHCSYIKDISVVKSPSLNANICGPKQTVVGVPIWLILRVSNTISWKGAPILLKVKDMLCVCTLSNCNFALTYTSSNELLK